MECPKCGFSNTNTEECSRCGIFFEKFLENEQRQKILKKIITAEHELQKNKHPLIHEERWKVFLPLVAFFFIPLAKLLILPKLIFDSMHIWAHEFGHALIAWLGGRAATPFIIWTNIAEHRSFFVFICFLFLMIVILYKSYQEKTYFLFFCILLGILLQFYFYFMISEDQLDLAFTHSGIGGEFYLSTLAIMAYHYRFPKGSYWNFLRYWLLFAAAYIFFKSFYFWQQVQGGYESIPWGTALHGSHDQGGDMNKLRYVWDWSPQKIIHSYIQISYFCLSIMVIHYISILTITFLSKKPMPKQSIRAQD